MNLFVIISVLAAVGVSMASSWHPHKYKSTYTCLSGDGSSYRGIVSKSSNGRECLRWSSVKHAWSASNGVGKHNYCRNPNQRRKPWCYIQKSTGIKREYCDIPRCLKPAVKPTTTSPPPVDTAQTCGERSERRINKIVGGSFTPIESHPWVAALYHHGTFFCGGSLISPCWVLTAAHCYSEIENLKLRYMTVHLGRSAINETDATREQSFIVEKIIIHENYNENNYDHDIALLKIKSTSGACAVKTPSVRTVCLPPLYTQLPPGVICSIAGFGKEKFNSATFSPFLKQADVNLLSNTECQRDPYYKNVVTENMICAASPDWSIDACKGDSGGPLVYEASGRMFLFGVVSWGIGCAAVNKPGVYTRVTNYNKWIAAKTGLPEYTKGKLYPAK